MALAIRRDCPATLSSSAEEEVYRREASVPWKKEFKLALETSGVRACGLGCRVQGSLTNKKPPPQLGKPYGSRHMLVQSLRGGGGSYKRGTPVAMLRRMCETAKTACPGRRGRD